MRTKPHTKIRRDKEGYEYGGEDLSKMRVLTGKEREGILKKVQKGRVRRFLEKLTA